MSRLAELGMNIKLSASCWEWQGSRLKAGYGRITWNRKQYLTHRLMFETLRGPIPTGYYVCHTCDNPSCIRPTHLFLGTAKDNEADMTQKGRRRQAIGAAINTAKLNPKRIREIRSLAIQGVSGLELGVRFGIHNSTVSRILNGKIWGHVETLTKVI